MTVRARGDEARGDRLLSVGLLHEAGAERLQRRGSAPFAMGDEAGRNIVLDSRHVRCKTQCRVELVLERSGIGDDGEFADALLPGRKLELGAGRVAVHQHVVDGGGRVRGQSVPDPEALQQGDRRAVERIGPNVAEGCAAHGRATQGDRETQASQCERQRLADDAGAGDLDIEGRHGPDCRQRSRDNRRPCGPSTDCLP